MTRDAYAEAGVSFDSAEKTTGFIAGSAATTLNARVIAGVGSFGAVYDMSNMSGYPYLVASSDTCGTKTMVAAELKKTLDKPQRKPPKTTHVAKQSTRNLNMLLGLLVTLAVIVMIVLAYLLLS